MEGEELKPNPDWTPPLTEEAKTELAADIPEVHRAEPQPDRLSPTLAFDMGRRTIALEQSELIDKFLGEQKQIFQDTFDAAAEAAQAGDFALYKRLTGELSQALVDRDRVIAQMGRMLSDGKMATNLLREFVRGQLMAMDRGTPEALQRLLEDTFGKKPMHADARQIARHGHTLGPSIDQKMDPEQHAIDTASSVPKEPREVVQHTPAVSLLDEVKRGTD